MKKFGAVLIAVIFIAGVMLSYFLGNYISDKEHEKMKVQDCCKYISLAIDIVEDKGISVTGASETVASNLWIAHELCNIPEVSAELSDLWNDLVYGEDTYNGQEDVLVAKLKDILNKCQ